MSDDNNLDNFFATKDKSKKKPTKSSFTPDDIEQLREKKLKGKKGSKPKRHDGTEESSQISKDKVEDDEWNYYEEVVKDYSGLKIHNLAPGTKNGTEQESNGNQSGDEEVGEKDAAHGPWKAVAEVEPEPEPEVIKPVVVVDPPKTGKYVPPGARQQMSQSQTAAPSTEKSTGKYIPPAMRNQASATQAVVVSKPKKPTKAPDVKNVEDFPSLKSAPLVEQGTKLAQNFEKVKGGAKQGASQSTASKISLNNKFGALEDGDS